MPDRSVSRQTLPMPVVVLLVLLSIAAAGCETPDKKALDNQDKAAAESASASEPKPEKQADREAAESDAEQSDDEPPKDTAEEAKQGDEAEPQSSDAQHDAEAKPGARTERPAPSSTGKLVDGELADEQLEGAEIYLSRYFTEHHFSHHDGNVFKLRLGAAELPEESRDQIKDRYAHVFWLAKSGDVAQMAGEVEETVRRLHKNKGDDEGDMIVVLIAPGPPAQAEPRLKQLDNKLDGSTPESMRVMYTVAKIWDNGAVRLSSWRP